MESQTLASLNIAAVERETGLSKDVLRKWEIRYGFPAPQRDSLGERAYPADQVNRLRLIKRLMDAGMRPSRQRLSHTWCETSICTTIPRRLP